MVEHMLGISGALGSIKSKKKKMSVKCCHGLCRVQYNHRICKELSCW
jgi:hypothetical protein